jgi:hypothetical protein
MWTVRDAVQIESLGKPVVAIITEEFVTHAQNIARTLGHNALRMLVLPYPLEGKAPEELDEIADRFYPKFLDLLKARG